MLQLIAAFGLLTGFDQAPALTTPDSLPAPTITSVVPLSTDHHRTKVCPAVCAATRLPSTVKDSSSINGADHHDRHVPHTPADVQQDAYPIRLEGHEAVWMR